MKHKKSKHSLDEMQDHNLLKIEELGFWLSFWVSFVVIVVQVLAGASLKEIAGEKRFVDTKLCTNTEN